MKILEERLRVGEEIALAIGDQAGERGAENVHLPPRRRHAHEAAEGLELALLQLPVLERRILDRVEHAQEQVGERDTLAEGQIELRDAESKAAAHRIEMALVEIAGSHSTPLGDRTVFGSRRKAAR